jgi:hypothetical protein
MRLLTNVVNEYSVFSRRLIVEEQGVKGLEADELFAMVVYKNVHLGDFERIQLGRSNLDSLYRGSRDVVNQSIAVRRSQLARIVNASELADSMTELASPFASTLRWYVERVRALQSPNYPVVSYTVGDDTFEPEQLAEGEFWRALLDRREGLQVTLQRGHISLTNEDIEALFARRLDFNAWERKAHAQVAQRRLSLERDITILTHSNFR